MTDVKCTKKVKKFVTNYFKNNHYHETAHYRDSKLVAICFDAYRYYTDERYPDENSWEDGMIFSYLFDFTHNCRLMYKYLKWAFKTGKISNSIYESVFSSYISLQKSYNVCVAKLKTYLQDGTPDYPDNFELSDNFKLSDFFTD